MEHPFYYLQSDGFWFLHLKPGREKLYQSYQRKRLTKKRLLETVEHAFLDTDTFNLFKCFSFRKALYNNINNMLRRQSLMNFGRTNNSSLVFQETTSLYKHEQGAINLIIDAVVKGGTGKLINNVLLHDEQSNNYFEIDILLATNIGLFAIELKHWTGHIRIGPHNWVVNETNYRTDPHKVNNFKAKIVKGIYQHRFRTYPNIWVESVVVLTNPDVTVEGGDSPVIAADRRLNNPTFASIGDLVAYLRRRANFEKQILDNRQVDEVIGYFSALDKPKQAIRYSVPGYETVEYIVQKPECIELIARPLHGYGKGLYRFRVFRTPQDASQKEKERFIKKAHNTITSVSQIGDHPHIHKVWTIKNEVGDIIEGSEWSETGTLRDLISKNKQVFKIENALKICYGIAEALKEAHLNNVIHRAVKPENILMLNDIPKLINFDLAYQIEDNRLTVIEDASKLKDDGYIAPEILFGQDIDERTDYFSLGVIAYELIVGEKPFSSTKTFAMQKGQLSEVALRSLRQTHVNPEMVNVIGKMILVDRNLRVSDINMILAAFRGADFCEEVEKKPLVVNRRLGPGDSHDVYEIIEYIGGGDESQIYKARTLHNVLVALKLFNKEVPRERIFMEAEVTSAIKSSYVVRCENKIGHWKNDRYFIVLEYIPGVSLRAIIESGEKPDMVTFTTIALGLMEAVRAFHHHKDSKGKPQPFLHSDIKPENIIVTKDKKGILIDCGISGEPRIDTFKGTIGYVPPDSLSGADMSFSEDGDLFALGVTLWEWLFGIRPYENPSIGDMVAIPEISDSDLPENIRNWIVKAISTESDSRFSTVDEMQRAFTMIMEEEPTEIMPTIPEKPDAVITGINISARPKKEAVYFAPGSGNPFVTYLNSLSNASAGNANATAEAQITSDYFRCIKVDNPITDYVYNKLTSERCNVILTGNAGDGKTTIAMEVFARLSGERKPLKPQEKLTRHGLIIIKDMSELAEADRISILKEAIASDTKYLIVSNTGTLIDSFSMMAHHGFKTSDSELLKALEAEEPYMVFDNHFIVLNIERIDSIKTACEVFKRMLEPENWELCLNCARVNECPIYNNVLLLQNRLDIVTRRVMLLYQRLFGYYVRLTMRQMTGHLAYAISAGMECSDVMAMSQTAIESSLCKYLFFNRFFGDDGSNVSPEALQLYPIRQIIKEEFGIVLDPYFERKVWIKEGASFQALGSIELPKNIVGKILKGAASSDRRQLRRIIFFFGNLSDASGKQFIGTYLRSPMLLDYNEILGGSGNMPTAKESILRYRILQVLQEYFIGLKLPEERWHADDLYITVKQGIAGSGAQMVLADFRTFDFELVAKPCCTIGSMQKRMLCLQFNNTRASLRLDLPFFDYVARRYEGEVTEELSAYYADRLERFKVELVEHFYKNKSKEEKHLRLLMVGTDRKFNFMKIAVDGNRLEVL